MISVANAAKKNAIIGQNGNNLDEKSFMNLKKTWDQLTRPTLFQTVKN
jgi:hypothetical protein